MTDDHIGKLADYTGSDLLQQTMQRITPLFSFSKKMYYY